MLDSGFELIAERELREVGGNARMWRHLNSGAELLSIINEDENKCFGVSFYTPPTDSTGVAHILEHSVLCGSVKYPLKEPFAELLKGSLQTFLNAFTFPDKTCYPVASANLQDFYNLMDVYLDAVFHPLLSTDTFRQEGWHIEAESADGPWTFKGVVYNEMKGVYSSPDAILAERSQQAVFPDNLYNLDSGGNPECIPNLTYQDFKDFYLRYYQPGNARFFFWGDDPESERLKRIDSVINSYGPVGELPRITLQTPPSVNRYVEVPYASTADEKRGLVTLNWLLAERGNIHEALMMQMLEHILEGLPGSPLRRALIESGLGEDTAGCGLETDLRQMYYSTGLKGLAPANAGKVEQVILDTLSDLSKNGIDPLAVEAAVNSVEFAYREDNSGRFPRGLSAMLLSLSSWLYGGDPIAALAWEKPLNSIKSDIASGRKIFENAIREKFLANPFTRVTLLPDPGLAQTRENAEKARLNALQAQTGPEARQQLVRQNQELQALQLAPDTPEDLAKIPALHVSDLPKKNTEIPAQLESSNTHTFIAHPLPTRGIAYCTLLLPLSQIPSQMLPLLPLVARSLIEFGSSRNDYSQLGMKIAAKTGGLSASILTGAQLGSREPFCYLSLGGKAVYDKISDLFALMQEILLDPQTDHVIMRQRLELMVREAKARLEHALQAGAHSTVSLRLAAHFTGEGALAEQMNGITQLKYIRELLERIRKEPDAVVNELTQARRLLIAGEDAIFDLAAETSAIAGIQKRAEAMLNGLPRKDAAAFGADVASWPAMSNLSRAEAFLTPGQVNYVGKGANVYDLGYTYSGAANVIMRWLRMSRLWEEVRVAGGAYGAFCSLDRISGTLICASYRDPNVDRTLSAYDGLASYIRNFAPSRAQVEQAIVGAVGALDTYLLPDARAASSLAWHLSGLTAESRQQTRDEMMEVTGKDFHEFGDVLEAFAQSGDICVVGGAVTAAAAKDHNWDQERLI